jgi:hypothetical protein
MNIKHWLAAMIMGAICGAIFVGLSHILSRPAGDDEVIGAAISAAVMVAFANRHRI